MKRLLLIAVALLAACSGDARTPGPAPATTETAVFAGGCFWCTEADFEKIAGVIDAVSGYTGGRTRNPTYESVTAGNTGHYEAVRVTYDPARVTYGQLARHFFRTVDPTDAGGQFCDRGDSYRTAIFVQNAGQRAAADRAKAEANRILRARVVTPILPLGTFTPAEAYHQGYYRKNPVRYRYYRWRCGREARLRAVWGDQAAR
jgi:peptide-methionine (S)-S-oxide reductase